MNITDVGHLTDDGDHGEDKMEKGARQQGITARDVAEKFTTIYVDDLSLLKVDQFDVMPRATDHIAEQIAMIQELEAKGYTYSIEGDGIYMDTSKVNDYGKLIGKKHMEGLEQGARIDDAGKRNATDFALWKFNITGKKRDMEWESPWGI
jgi:cysteinyl-tRNA synthetase